MSTKDFQNIDPQDVTFDDIDNIDAITMIFGLSFPDQATEFQKSCLTLAHIADSCRNAVLRGIIIPENVLAVLCKLSNIVMWSSKTQK